MVVFGYLYLIFFPIMGLFYSIYGFCKNPKKWRKYVFFLVYFFFIGAYVYETSSELEDLVRYIPIIEEYGKLSFSDALQLNNNMLFAQNVLFWLFGSLKIPHMVPAISTATVYAVALYITCDTAERYGKENYIGIISLFQLAMLPYVNLINNVRNVFALALIVLAVYLDLVKRKRNLFVIFCYVFGCFMHLSAFVLVLFRFLSWPLKNAFELVVVFPIIFVPLVNLLYKIRYLLNYVGALGNSINQIIIRLYGYINNSHLSYSILSLNSATVKIDRTIMIIGMSMALVLLCYGLRTNKQFFMDNKQFYVFSGLIALLSILFGVTMPMPNFWRFSAAFYTTFGVLIIPYVVQFKKMPILLKFFIPVYAMIGLLSLLMQVWKFTWIEFGNWMLAFFTANMLTVFYDLISGIVRL